jgi:HlyD family secretion protein
MMQRKTWVILALVPLIVAGALLATRKGKEAVKWRQGTVQRGPMQQRISATGTLSALVQVNVGTQVSGTISSLAVDYNTQVTKGQVVAQIDPTLLQTALQDANAGLERARTNLDDAKRQLERAKRLFKEKLIPEQDLEARQVTFETAGANLLTAKSALQRAKTNLSYATITAPVSGVVVSRNVDIGQTVAASFNTPTLFTIAQDLTKMKLEVSIDEADIGQVKESQPSLFTVDSYPDTQFRGRVNQVRLEPIVQQNVVTYKVVVQVENEDLKLRPGMTANVSILTQARENVLKVPSSALRFNPMAFLPASDTKAEKKAEAKAEGKAEPKAEAKTPPKEETKGEGRGRGESRGMGGGRMAAMGGLPVKGLVARREDRVWILENGKPKAITVKAGITDGQFTEVSGEGLSEGQQVLIGVEDTKRAAAGAPPLAGPGGGGMPRR